MYTAFARFHAFVNLLHMRNLEIIVWVTLGVTLTMVGDVFLKRSQLGSIWLLAGGLVFYFLGCIPVILLFRLTNFGMVFILWEALTVVLAVTIGHLVFAERVTANKLAAVALVICALVIVNR